MLARRIVALALLIILCGCDGKKRVMRVHQVQGDLRAKGVRRAYKDR
jgi:hypothetical protein